jgi:N-acetylmuramoyl-L-alanine amidase
LPVVVLDAGHGGDDSGERSRDGVLEKDLVAQLVARVRLALLSSQKFRIVLTRTSDVNPSFEERTTAANLAGAVVFLTFHAGDSGPASPHIAVYVYEPPSPPAPAPEDETPRPVFLPWVNVQQAHLEQSRQLAVALQEQFAPLAGATTEAPQAAPVRVLRSVNASAVAVEIGRLAPDADAGPVANPDFLQRLSSAVAEGVLAFIGKRT